jgi:hypothetical protein
MRSDPGETTNAATRRADELVNAFFPGSDAKTKRERAGQIGGRIKSIITKLIG